MACKTANAKQEANSTWRFTARHPHFILECLIDFRRANIAQEATVLILLSLTTVFGARDFLKQRAQHSRRTRPVLSYPGRAFAWDLAKDNGNCPCDQRNIISIFQPGKKNLLLGDFRKICLAKTGP